MSSNRRRVRYKALIEYDGSGYFGFQRQRPEQITVQSEFERVISHLAQEPVVITGAGRTDSGVHALGQVVSFTISWRHGVKALQRALNAGLPSDIVVLQLNETSSDFHPRFDAVARAYRYWVYNAPERSPTRRRNSWHLAQPLDVARMNLAAAALIGTHDFATFGTPPQGDSTVRELYAAEWTIEAPYVVFYVKANAFLYRMVRSLVGSLVAVGSGKWTVEQFVEVFHFMERNRSAAAAPPQGLYLVSVDYKQE